MFIIAVFTILKIWKHPKFKTALKCINTHGTYAQYNALAKRSPAIYDNLDENEYHYVS